VISTEETDLEQRFAKMILGLDYKQESEMPKIVILDDPMQTDRKKYNYRNSVEDLQVSELSQFIADF